MSLPKKLSDSYKRAQSRSTASSGFYDQNIQDPSLSDVDQTSSSNTSLVVSMLDKLVMRGLG